VKRSFAVTSGTTLRCKSWRQEGLLRLLENVLAVGDPDNLVVYAALGRAARDWPSHDRIVATLKTMDEGETLLVQSGKPIGVMKTHAKAPIVLMANCNLVGQWAKPEIFYELEKKSLICWGGLTAGDWQYIGSQGVIQGTYEIFMRIAERISAAIWRAASCSPRGSAAWVARSRLPAPWPRPPFSASRSIPRASGGASRPATWTRPRKPSTKHLPPSRQRAMSVARYR
jgi:hypothetical protein